MNADHDFVAYVKSLPPDRQKEEVQDEINSHKNRLVDAPDLSAAMNMTNATDFDIEEVEVSEISFTADEIRVEFTFRAEGTQDQDRPWSGTSLKGEATAVIGPEREIRFQDVSAEQDFEDGYDEA